MTIAKSWEAYTDDRLHTLSREDTVALYKHFSALTVLLEPLGESYKHALADAASVTQRLWMYCCACGIDVT